jgi:hypothetical protein
MACKRGEEDAIASSLVPPFPGPSFSFSQQLKARWRELSRRWHPDRNPANPNAGQFFQMFSAAYQQLA